MIDECTVAPSVGHYLYLASTKITDRWTFETYICDLHLRLSQHNNTYYGNVDV